MNEQYIKTFTKGLSKKISENFYLNEFDCKCDSDDCKETIINMTHVARLEQLRREIGKPIKINSAYRCVDHNNKVGGAKASQHILGNATDIDLTGIDETRLKRIFPGVILYDNFTHVDSRDKQKIYIDKRTKH